MSLILLQWGAITGKMFEASSSGQGHSVIDTRYEHHIISAPQFRKQACTVVELGGAL